MAAFIIATVNITDPAKFAAYSSAIAGLSEAHGGESIVKGSVLEVLEGEAQVGERVVVTRFATADAARAYIASARYQTARAGRQDAAVVVMRLVEA